MQALKSVPDPT